MNEFDAPVEASFEVIKGGLDPAHSYMFFERSVARGGHEGFSSVFEALRVLGIALCGSELFFDEQRGRFILLVKLEPGSTEGIMHDLLAIGLPRDITFFAYSSHRVG